MKRSSDALTAATTSILKPALKSHGFRSHSRRCFVRQCGDVLQIVDLQVSAYGSRDFAVNHGSMGLFPPREYLCFPTGGRLPRGRSGDGWWKSGTHEQADRSMNEVWQIFERHALPFFQQGSTLLGFSSQMEALLPSKNAHTYFNLACCVARLGDRARALALISQAIKFYHAHQANTGATWCMVCINQAQELADAISHQVEFHLLDQWTNLSRAALKLENTARAP